MTIELHCHVSRNIRLSITPVGNTKITIEEPDNPAVVIDSNQNHKLLGCVAPYTIVCAGATDESGCISFDGPVTAYIDALGIEVHAESEDDLIAKLNALTGTTKIFAKSCVDLPPYDFIIPLQVAEDNSYSEDYTTNQRDELKAGLIVDALMPEEVVDPNDPESPTNPAILLTMGYAHGWQWATVETPSFLTSGRVFLKSIIDMFATGTDIQFEEIKDAKVFDFLSPDIREYVNPSLGPFTMGAENEKPATYRWFGVNINFPPTAPPDGGNYPTHIVLRRPSKMAHLSELNPEGDNPGRDDPIIYNYPLTSINSLLLADSVSIPIGESGEKLYNVDYNAETMSHAVTSMYFNYVYDPISSGGMDTVMAFHDADYVFGNAIDATVRAINIQEVQKSGYYVPADGEFANVQVFNFRGLASKLLRLTIPRAPESGGSDYTLLVEDPPEYRNPPQLLSANPNQFPYSIQRRGRYSPFCPVDAALEGSEYMSVDGWSNAIDGAYESFTFFAHPDKDYDVMVLVPYKCNLKFGLLSV